MAASLHVIPFKTIWWQCIWTWRKMCLTEKFPKRTRTGSRTFKSFKRRFFFFFLVLLVNAWSNGRLSFLMKCLKVAPPLLSQALCLDRSCLLFPTAQNHRQGALGEVRVGAGRGDLHVLCQLFCSQHTPGSRWGRNCAHCLTHESSHDQSALI